MVVWRLLLLCGVCPVRDLLWQRAQKAKKYIYYVMSAHGFKVFAWDAPVLVGCAAPSFDFEDLAECVVRGLSV
jgi:hypothetical protein